MGILNDHITHCVFGAARDSETGAAAQLAEVAATIRQVVRDGIRQILGQHPGIQVVGEANSAEIALALIKQLQPSVVLMDIRRSRDGGCSAPPGRPD